MNIIYFDNAATTKIRKDVLDYAKEYDLIVLQECTFDYDSDMCFTVKRERRDKKLLKKIVCHLIDEFPYLVKTVIFLVVFFLSFFILLWLFLHIIPDILFDFYLSGILGIILGSVCLYYLDDYC